MKKPIKLDASFREWRIFPFLPLHGFGLLHRVGGPAVERASGIKEWWLMGRIETLQTGIDQRVQSHGWACIDSLPGYEGST
jgi:hypothetical protein